MLAAFLAYAAWAPHACADMPYEALQAEGKPASVRRLLAWLGLPLGLAPNVTGRLGRLAAAELGSSQQPPAADTGLMPGHVTRVTTRPGAHRAFRRHLKLVSTWCDLERELQLVASGSGSMLMTPIDTPSALEEARSRAARPWAPPCLPGRV